MVQNLLHVALAIGLLFFHHTLTLGAQSIFHHRYAAHGMFYLTKRGEKLFYLFSWMVMGPSYLSPYVYGILHRRHHKYADTDEDPHSPKNYDGTWGLFKMMWDTKSIYVDIDTGVFIPESWMTRDLPQWERFDKFAGGWVSRLVWAVVYVFAYVALGMPWWLYPLLLIHFTMGPLHGAVINWYAHKYGTRRYEVDDTSSNLPKIVSNYFMYGEGWHNNHHGDQYDANFGRGEGEYDLYYWIIKNLFVLKE